MIRKAILEDIPAVVKIYDGILKLEECGQATTGWVRNIYPTEQTALDALKTGSLFVYDDSGTITACAKIDNTQVPEYAQCRWTYNAPDSEVAVLHTLVVDPSSARRGYGKEFVAFYEEYAAAHGCKYLRMDTNISNSAARAMYKKLGYTEVGTVGCVFNGISNVQLVCLEKKV